MDEDQRKVFDDWVNETIAKELTSQGDLLPPWQKYPEIQAGSIGWRMGYGEAYMIAWDKWASLRNQEQLLEYFKNYLPIPMDWLSWVSYRFGDKNIAHEFFSGGGNFDGIRWLDQQGLTDFSEFKSWYDSWYAEWQNRKGKKG